MDDELIYNDFIEPVVNSPRTFVPIIGEDMYMVGKQSLQEYVFGELASPNRAHYFNGNFSEKREEMLQVPYYEFLSKAQRCMKSPKDFSTIYRGIVDKATKEGTLTLRHDIRNLLKKADFPLIITTLCWPVIETIVGSNKYKPIWHRWGQNEETNLEPIPADGHTVYHLLGQSGVRWVSNERTLLDCLHSHQNTTNSLSKYLKDCRLLCFGCHLPNWIFRFLWYPMTKLKDKQYPDSMSEGLWEQADHADDFDAFLEDIGYRRTDNLEEYLNALTKAFSSIEKSSDAGVNERKGPYKYDIFLSYKSEDKEVALKIHNILTKDFGLVVWMDKDKRTGDLHQGGDYWERIRHGIENSRYFMPVVSKEYYSSWMEASYDKKIGPDSNIGFVKETYMAMKHLSENEEKYKAQDPHGVLVYSLPVFDVKALNLSKVIQRIDEGTFPEKFFKGVESYYYTENADAADTFHNHDWNRYQQG